MDVTTKTARARNMWVTLRVAWIGAQEWAAVGGWRGAGDPVAGNESWPQPGSSH